MKRSLLIVIIIMVIFLLAAGAFTFAWFSSNLQKSQELEISANEIIYLQFEAGTDPVIGQDVLIPATARPSAIAEHKTFTRDDVIDADLLSESGGLSSLATVVVFTKHVVYFEVVPHDLRVTYGGYLNFDPDTQTGDIISERDIHISVTMSYLDDGDYVEDEWNAAPTVENGLWTAYNLLEPGTTYLISVRVWFAAVDDELDPVILNTIDNGGIVTIFLAAETTTE
ncbi:MAG: hypothetical protein ACOYIN_03440 [Christensenellales bacterium]|jgi:hypothetical protein|nr:hypothetical protein [Clostridia bacterium]